MSKLASTLSDISQFVTFTVNNESFGVLIQIVEEIIILPEKVTPVPRAPTYFSGMINLRGEIISVIDLRQRFQLPPVEPTNMTRILVVSITGIKVGMIVDAVIRVFPIAKNEVRLPPAILNHSESKYIFGSVQQEETVLLLLDTDELIPPEELHFQQQLQEEQEAGEVVANTTSREMIPHEQERILIGFKLGEEHFSLDITHVEEIIELPQITPVPEMSNLIDGIFYQRDQALPILGLGRRFHMPQAKFTEDTAVLIVREQDLFLGFIVDQITEVFHILPDDMLALPANISGKSAEQFEGIVKVNFSEAETTVVMALNLQNILTEEEQEHLLTLQEELNEIEDHALGEENTSETISLLKFRVNDEIFALRVLEINEITTMQKMVAVPKAPRFVNGVINLRGDIITIIGMAKLFGSDVAPITEKSRIIVVQIGEQKAGFQVDQIIGIDHFSYALFEAPSGILKGQYNLFIEGIGREPNTDEVIILIDTQETLTQSEMYDGEWTPPLLEAPTEE